MNTSICFTCANDTCDERKASVQQDTPVLETEKQSSNLRLSRFKNKLQGDAIFFFNESIEPKALVIQLNWNLGVVVRVV